MPPQDAYLESQVLTADPMELVRLLYRGARDATRSAKTHLAAGRIAERSRQISKAHSILTQLSGSLDHLRGGTLSRSLAELYDYMQRCLLDSNLRQKPEPLIEVERLLSTLLEGWEQIGSAPEGSREPEDPRSRMDGASNQFGSYPGVFAPPATTGSESQSWSF